MAKKALSGISDEENLASAELIDFMKIISEFNRFRIIQLLYNNSEITVMNLSKLLTISQPAVSQHLKVLKMMRFVKLRKDGRKTFYSVDFEGIHETYGKGIDYLRRYFLNEK